MILNFSSFQEKMAGTITQANIIQQPVGQLSKTIPCQEINYTMYASLYHIGDHKNINEKYEMIQRWADENDYALEEGSFERYVVDYWSTTNINDFVTEILVPLQKK